MSLEPPGRHFLLVLELWLGLEVGRWEEIVGSFTKQSPPLKSCDFIDPSIPTHVPHHSKRNERISDRVTDGDQLKCNKSSRDIEQLFWIPRLRVREKGTCMMYLRYVQSGVMSGTGKVHTSEERQNTGETPYTAYFAVFGHML